ncbi:cell division protein SepF [Micromonospora sp. CPCC 205371]|nr:cell division protein SepF [Micromonospora sp. CPCC 205371]
MSALRKAGVWLGLVEEDDDRSYDDGYDKGRYRERESSYRDRESRYADDYADDEEEIDEPPALPRSRSRLARELTAARGDHADRPSTRAEASRAELERAEIDRDRQERASVRSITRPAAPEPPAPVAYPTRENLALAPQVQLRERAVVADEDQRYQITTLHPTTYREARTIGEHFRDGVPVIINLTEMDEADARRLVDFAAGLAFGLRGTIERVTNRVFLLSPANVQVTAEDKAKIAEGGFFTMS